MILSRPGEAISPIARLAEPGTVGAAVGAAREHRFHDLLRAGELQRLDVESGFLEVAFFDRCVEREPGRNRPVPDADLGPRLRARQARQRETAHASGSSGEQAAAGRTQRGRRGSYDAMLHGNLQFRSI